jgi:Eukaryotic aspartyl protease
MICRQQLDAGTNLQITLDSIEAGNYKKEASDLKITAIVDSGTSLMVGSKAEITKLAAAVDATANIMVNTTPLTAL